jgi:hypothetical protein
MARRRWKPQAQLNFVDGMDISFTTGTISAAAWHQVGRGQINARRRRRRRYAESAPGQIQAETSRSKVSKADLEDEFFDRMGASTKSELRAAGLNATHLQLQQLLLDARRLSRSAKKRRRHHGRKDLQPVGRLLRTTWTRWNINFGNT